MVKVQNIIKKEILNIMVILSITNMREMENIIGQMVNIILDNLKEVKNMEKVLNIIKMEKLNMKVILLMVKEKEMENIIGKIIIIILGNLKII